MNTLNNTMPQPTAKRPALVWVISMFYFILCGISLLLFILAVMGALPFNEAERAAFDSLTIFDYGFSVIKLSLLLAGAVALLMLRRHAFHLFTAALVLSLLNTGYYIVAKNWLSTVGTRGFLEELFILAIDIAIIFYAWRLIKRGTLK